MVNENLVLKTGVSSHSVELDLNFRLRLDIAGANLRIEDKIIESEGQWYVDPEHGLDMDFDIVKTDDNVPNESSITIWNLNDETYTNIKNNATAFELFAAFSNDEYSLMFRGYPQKALRKSKGTILTSNQGFLKQDANAGRSGQNDIETVLTLIDGKYEYEDAFFSKSYQTEVSTETVLKDIIETFGVPTGNIAQIEHRKLLRPYYRMKSVTAMNNLAKLLGFNWSLTNGVFYLYTTEIPKQPYGIELHSFNSATPERQDDKFKTHTKTIVRKNKKKGIAGVKKTTIQKTEMGYKISTRLLPFLLPGTQCFCDFPDLVGTKYIYKVHHKGNNYGTVAETEVYVV